MFRNVVKIHQFWTPIHIRSIPFFEVVQLLDLF